MTAFQKNSEPFKDVEDILFFYILLFICCKYYFELLETVNVLYLQWLFKIKIL